MGLTSLIPLLLQKGAELERKDRNGNTPLLLACESSLSGSEDAAIALLNNGANVNVTNASRKSAAMLAAKTGKAKVFELLVEKGIDLSLKDQLGLTAEDYKSS